MTEKDDLSLIRLMYGSSEFLPFDFILAILGFMDKVIIGYIQCT